jgi:hypothetical protein
MKKCSRCKNVLYFESFQKDRNRKDGLDGVCKRCRSKWRKENRENENRRKKEWKNKNKDKAYAMICRRRHREANLFVEFNYWKWKRTLFYFGYRCCYCGKSKVKITKDHIVPISQGGETSHANLIPACFSCNSSKGKKPMVDWYCSQEYFDPGKLQKIIQYVIEQNT